MATATATRTSSSAAFGDDAIKSDHRLCADGCGAQVTGKAIYRPGHDARHVSVLVQQAIDADFAHGILEQGLDTLGNTTKLAVKYHRAYDRAWDRREAKRNRAERRATPATQDGKAYRTLDAEGTVKVGRWSYPARRWVRNETGEFWFERNTARDGSGEWVDASNGGATDGDNLTQVKGAKRIKEAVEG